MVYLIVPTFGRLDLTRQFLLSLQNYLCDKYAVIIIDDKPPDYETYHALRTAPQVTCLKGTGDLWWGGSINLGIDYLLSKIRPTGSDICIFANNDVRINADTYPALAAALTQNPNALFHPRTFDPHGREVSSGAKVVSWLPYLTRHPIGDAQDQFEVDLGTTRFLCFTIATLQAVGCINKKLPQYAGDNDFTLRAKTRGMKTHIVTGATCRLGSPDMAMKTPGIDRFPVLLQSFFSIKSPNNLKYRFNLFHSHFNAVFSAMIVCSMTFNAFAKFFINKFKKLLR